MPIPYKVVRDGLLLVKIEATEGVDANPGAADAIDADVFLPTMDARTEERQAFTGAADAPAPIINGRQITFPFSTELVGTADPSTTPPRISPALQACAWEQTLTASQITDTATGGSTTTAIVPTTNFSGADDAYLGMPVVLTGANIGGTGVGTFVTTVTDWVNSTGTLTFSDTIPRAVTSGDTVTIPTHARYHPGSVADAPSVTAYLYIQDRLYKLLRGRGNIDLVARTPSSIRATFSITGEFAGELSGQTKPTGVDFGTLSAPLLKRTTGGYVVLNRIEAATSQITVGSNNTIITPENANRAEGYDSGIITGRSVQIQADPLVTDSLNFGDLMTNSTEYPAVIRAGTVAGNRVAVTVPRAFPSGANPQDRQGLLATAAAAQALGANATTFLSFF